MDKIYGVIFNQDSRRYYYEALDEYKVDELVVVETPRGEELGKVCTIVDKASDISGHIVRLAEDQDYDAYLKNLKNAQRAYKKCKEFASELGLEMNIINASFNLDRSQLLFNFTAEGRVDFRELAKMLAREFHTRIELRQVGARDKAKCIGGVGVCGGQLCCIRFLHKTDTISMNMAKNQNLALNPSKINGACGRLLCCLQYEDPVYLEALESLPSVGDIIDTPKGSAKVVSLDILNKRCKIDLNGEIVDYEFDSKK